MTGTEEIVEAGPLTSFGEEVKAAVEDSFVENYMKGGRRRGVLCANPDCRWHKEVKGGSFSYSAERHGFFCDDCFFVKPLLSDCKNLWEFDTTHFNGQKIHVRDRNHLDLLCKQFGVSNHAREFNRSNWDSPPSVRPQETNRELDRMLGKAREMGQRDRGHRVSGGFQE
jgi:hypothetical protein